MNFLAHSVLAFDDDALLAGQFAGDFVRGADLSAFPDRISAGIRLHRHVDAHTDFHPEVVAARRRFEPSLRRHAGIVIDVVFDHLLAGQWSSLQARGLPAHSRWVDGALARHADHLPESLQRFASFVARDRTLERNADENAVAETLMRLSRRSVNMAPLAEAASQVDRLAASLADPFAIVWPELVTFARDWLTTNDYVTHDPDRKALTQLKNDTE